MFKKIVTHEGIGQKIGITLILKQIYMAQHCAILFITLETYGCCECYWNPDFYNSNQMTKHACGMQRLPTGAALCRILFEMLWPNPGIYSVKHFVPRFSCEHRRQCKA